MDIVYIDSDYVNYLFERDDRVCYNKGGRPYLGPVFESNGFDYYAPMTTSAGGEKLNKKNKIVSETFLPIEECQYGGIKFNNMIPVIPGTVKVIDIEPNKNDDTRERNRKNHFSIQMYFIMRNEELIKEKAKSLYENKLLKKLDKTPDMETCKFETLENAATRYAYNKSNSLPQDSLIKKYGIEPSDFKNLKYEARRRFVSIEEVVQEAIINERIKKYNPEIRTKLLAERNTVKTSLQSDEKKETKELTPKQIEIAKNLSDRTGKPVDRVIKVFEYIHNNGIFAPKEPVASKQKVIVKTQEKNISKPVAVKTKKSNQDQNSR